MKGWNPDGLKLRTGEFKGQYYQEVIEALDEQRKLCIHGNVSPY